MTDHHFVLAVAVFLFLQSSAFDYDFHSRCAVLDPVAPGWADPGTGRSRAMWGLPGGEDDAVHTIFVVAPQIILYGLFSFTLLIRFCGSDLPRRADWTWLTQNQPGGLIWVGGRF